MKKDIKTLTLKNLEEYLLSINYPKYHAKQIFSWIYSRAAEDFNKMSDLPIKLRKDLENDFYLSSFIIKEKLISRDQTRKYLFELEDKNTIESVLIMHEHRNTICLSTQVGCKYRCEFCASGALGFVRNLNQAEILNQILTVKKDSRESVNNIVFMGMGEPLDNYETVLNSIRIINADYGFNIGQRKITISTSGLAEEIKKLARERLQIELSVSLHSAFDEKRNKIMPINKKYPLGELISCLKEFIKLTKRKITFEYVLLGGFNTSMEDVKMLAKIMKGLNCKINLIPFNAVDNRSSFMPPNKLEVLFFMDYLLKHNVDVTIRQPHGADIQAACGQLRMRSLK